MPTGVTNGEWLDRIQGEYLELPAVRLSGARAGRLWDVDPCTCDGLLAALVDVRFPRRESARTTRNRGGLES
jgi:hypothetical protein